MAIDILKQTAVHEIGHVIMAYHFNYSVNFTSIDKAIPGEGKTEISWKPDNIVINLLTNPLFSKERESLKNADEDDLFSLTKKFIMVMSAGTAAEVIYEKKETGATAIGNINGADNDFIADFLDNLTSIGFGSDPMLVNQCFQTPLSLFGKDEYWKALDELADLLLSKDDHRLGKQEIEEYLTNAGLKK